MVFSKTSFLRLFCITNGNFMERCINAITIVKMLLESLLLLPIHLFTYLPACLYACLPACLPAYPRACLPLFCLLFAYLPAYLPASLILLFHPNALRLSIPLASII
jgi:hypothetical protein